MKKNRAIARAGLGLGVAALLLAGVGIYNRTRTGGPAAPVEQAKEDGTEQQLRKAVAAQPRDPRPHLQLIAHLAQAGCSLEALEAAQEAHTAFPESGSVSLVLADLLATRARLPEAVAIMQPLARIDPAHRVRLAGILVRDGRREEAVSQLKGVVRPAPELALRMGQVYLDALRPELAVPLFRIAADARASDPDVQAHYGLALVLTGRYREAVAVLQRALASASDAAAIRYYIGSAIRLSGDLERLPEAAEHLQRAAELEPSSALYHYELGLAYVQLRTWPNAVAAVERAATLKPDLAEVQRDLARLYRRERRTVDAAAAQSRYLRLMGDAPQAVRELEPLMKADPAELKVTLELGEAYYDSWKTPSTLTLLQRLASAQPRNAEVLSAVYRGERAANHNEKSLQALDRLLQVTPDRADLLLDRADLLQRLGRYAELEALLTRLRDREPAIPDRHVRLGLVLAQWSSRKDRGEAAAASFREALRLQPDHAEAHYRLGLQLQSAGRPAAALPHLRRALELSPRATDLVRALARTYALLGERQRSEELFRQHRRLNAIDDEQRRLEMPSSLHRATHPERERLARFYVRTGRYESAVVELESVLHARPDDQETRRMLVGLYGHLRRFQRHFEERERLGGRTATGAGRPG